MNQQVKEFFNKKDIDKIEASKIRYLEKKHNIKRRSEYWMNYDEENHLTNVENKKFNYDNRN